MGRVLGGITTSLLFSAFESWMVSEHRKKGFPDELLSSTFAMASWGNGVMAIGAGFLAQFASGKQCPSKCYPLMLLLFAVHFDMFQMLEVTLALFRWLFY